LHCGFISGDEDPCHLETEFGQLRPQQFPEFEHPLVPAVGLPHSVPPRERVLAVLVPVLDEAVEVAHHLCVEDPLHHLSVVRHCSLLSPGPAGPCYGRRNRRAALPPRTKSTSSASKAV